MKSGTVMTRHRILKELSLMHNQALKVARKRGNGIKNVESLDASSHTMAAIRARTIQSNDGSLTYHYERLGLRPANLQRKNHP